MTVDATPANADAASAAPKAPSEPNVDVKDLLAKVSKLDEMAKQLDEVRADNAKYREEKRVLKAKEEEAARMAGNLEPLLKAKEAEVERLRAELGSLAPLAERAKVLDKQRAEKISEKAKALSPEDRAVVDAITDIDTREKLVERLSAGVVKPNPPPNAASAASGAEYTAADIESGRLSPDEARTKHPKLWRSYVDSQNEGKSPILAAFGR